MNERSVFLAAIEIDDPKRRAAYLREVCGDDPDLRRSVDELLQASASAGSFMDLPAVTIGSTDSDTHPETAVILDFLAPSDQPGSLGRLGHYEILNVVGSGGMGIVLKAHDEKLSRVVAIKVLTPVLAASAASRKRFVREAKTAAAVRNDHVIDIYAVEEDHKPPYLVMEYVSGQSLQERLDQDGPLAVNEILRIGMQTAQGLAAAHAQGLVHRDIKPANILLENGVERVKITDFGLARAAADASITQAGVIAGTPSYMSPEQARGEPVDQRSDLFSLGSVLYAMCSGHSPFRADSAIATVRRVCDDTPRRIRELNADIPDWLTEIIDRLLAKSPAERFQTAAEVAELLGEQLAHLQQSSGAQRPRAAAPKFKAEFPMPTTRGWRVAAALLALVGSLGITEATGVTQVVPTVIRIVTGEGTLVVEVNDPAVKVTVEGDGGLVISGAGLPEFRLRPGSYRVRAEKDGKRVPLDKELVTISRGGMQFVKVRFEQGREPLADDRTWVSLFNGKDLSGWKTHADQPGKWRVENGILSGDADGESHLFSQRADFQDFHLRTEVQINQTGKGGVFFRSDSGFSPAKEGKFPEGLEASIYNGPQGKGNRERETETTGSLYWINGFSGILVPNEDWFTLEVIARGRHIVIKINGQTTTDVHLSSDSLNRKGHLALMQRSGTVIRFRKIEINELSSNVTSILQPFVVLEDKGVPERKFDTLAEETDTAQNSPSPEMAETRRFIGHEAVVWSVAFSPDGSRALSGSGGRVKDGRPTLGSDFTVRLWDVASGQQLHSFQGHQHQVQSAAFTPDGRQAVGAGKIWAWRRWDAETGQELSGIPGDPGRPFWHLALSADASRLLSWGGKDKVLRLWDVTGGTELWNVEGLSEEVSAAAFANDGRHIGTAGGGKYEGPGLKPGSDYSIRVWNAVSGKEELRLRGHNGFVWGLAFLPDGRRLLSGGADNVLRLWDLQTREELHLYQGHTGGVNAIALSPDGRWAVSGGADTTVRLWDIETGKELCRYVGHTGQVRSVAVSPNCRYALSGGYDETVRLWQLPEPEK